MSGDGSSDQLFPSTLLGKVGRMMRLFLLIWFRFLLIRKEGQNIFGLHITENSHLRLLATIIHSYFMFLVTGYRISFTLTPPYSGYAGYTLVTSMSNIQIAILRLHDRLVYLYLRLLSSVS